MLDSLLNDSIGVCVCVCVCGFLSHGCILSFQSVLDLAYYLLYGKKNKQYANRTKHSRIQRCFCACLHCIAYQMIIVRTVILPAHQAVVVRPNQLAPHPLPSHTGIRYVFVALDTMVTPDHQRGGGGRRRQRQAQHNL